MQSKLKLEYKKKKNVCGRQKKLRFVGFVETNNFVYASDEFIERRDKCLK